MDLVTWQVVARYSMWIAGLGVAFAAASHASWRASVRGERLRSELGGSAFLVPVSAGLLLVTVSLAWGAATLFERGLWAVASLLLTWAAFESRRRRTA